MKVKSAVILLVVMWLPFCQEPPSRFVDHHVEINPVWADASSSANFEIDTKAKDFHFLWDRSEPMEGYLHPVHQDSQLVFQSIRQYLFTAVNVSDYREGAPQCYGITKSVDHLTGCDDDLTEPDSFFTGSESRIDKGIEFLTAGLKDGSIVGAALISDLMTTVGPVIGPTALLKYFKNDPALRMGFNEGKIHMAIVGIRKNYWGVQCREIVNKGCWFSELKSGYVPLERPVERPIYILIMGRNLDGHDHDRDNNPVIQIAEKLHNYFESDSTHVEVEFVTRGILGSESDEGEFIRKIEFIWELPPKESGNTGIVKIDTTSGYECVYNGNAQIQGKFSDSSISIIDQAPVEAFDSLEFYSKVQMSGNIINLILDCKSVRDTLAAEKQLNCEDEKFKSEMSRVTTRLSYDRVSSLSQSPWSSNNETAYSTLDMGDFIDGLQPSYYEAKISPFPRLSCE